MSKSNYHRPKYYSYPYSIKSSKSLSSIVEFAKDSSPIPIKKNGNNFNSMEVTHSIRQGKLGNPVVTFYTFHLPLSDKPNIDDIPFNLEVFVDAYRKTSASKIYSTKSYGTYEERIVSGKWNPKTDEQKITIYQLSEVIEDLLETLYDSQELCYDIADQIMDVLEKEEG